MQIFARTAVGKSIALEVEPSDTVRTLRQKIIEREGYNDADLYLVFGGKPMTDLDKPLSDFNIQKGAVVTALLRMLGGLVDEATLYDLISQEIHASLAKLPHKGPSECDVCAEPAAKVVTMCHVDYCDVCLVTSLKSTNFKLRCKCTKTSSAEALLPALTPFINEYREVREMLRHVDVQLCPCGALIMNSTLQSHGKCHQCKRIFCFFCNQKWDPATMRDQKYKCNDNCRLAAATKHAFESFNLSTAGAQTIPDRRACPNCTEAGAYGKKCKYHTCPGCSYQFCFMCLKSEVDCKAAGGTYGSKCVVAVQKPETFPHMLPH